jgi:pimeloyl-ACP methyl ester carboxylesterase
MKGTLSPENAGFRDPHDDASTTLAHDRFGAGPPVVLIHGIGSHRKVWRSVTTRLAESYDVIAVDLPGFGDSAPIPGRAVRPVELAEATARFLDEMGLDHVHLVVNSLGGWVSFDLAATGRALSVTALGAAGLHASAGSSRAGVRRLVLSRRLARATRPLLPRLLSHRSIRVQSFRDQCVHADSLPYDIALEAAQAYAACRGFESALRGTAVEPFGAGAEITVPVTAAYGDDDRIIPTTSRLRELLPAHTRWVELPSCGHVPMWDDPELVVRTILETIERSARPADLATHHGGNHG